MHIQSVENILARKDEEIEKLKETQRLFVTNYNKDSKNQFYNHQYASSQEINDNINQSTDPGNPIHDKPNHEYGDNQPNPVFASIDFKKNEENEKELKKLIAGNFNSNKNVDNNTNTLNNSNFANIDNLAYNFNSAEFNSFTNLSTKNSIKIPGRIFSNKKKI